MAAHAGKTVKLVLPRSLRRLLKRRRTLKLRLTARSRSSRHRRSVRKAITPKALNGEDRAMAEMPTGSVVAGCRIEGVVGRGGMGVVYRATQVSLERTVALKVIAPELTGAADFRERFKRESRLAASIEHPNVIPVYEAGEADELLYLIMRFVPAPTCAR